MPVAFHVHKTKKLAVLVVSVVFLFLFQVNNWSGVISSPAQAANPIPVGSEFQVNTQTDGNQESPNTAMDGSGNYVIIWNDGDGTDGDFYGVYAQRYSSGGAPQGSAFLVNSDQTNGDQDEAFVAMDASGNFVVAWTDHNGTDGDNNGVFGQRYNSSGVAQGSNFQVNTTNVLGDQESPHVAIDSAGNFVIAYQDSNGADGDGSGVYFQRYDSSGVAQGSETLVNTDTTSDQHDLEIAMDDSGNFVIVWTNDNTGDGDGSGIIAQRYNSSGVAQGANFIVNSTTAGDQGDSSISIDSDGDFVIVWVDGNDADGDQNGVFGQRFDDGGVAQGGEFQVNSQATGNQDGADVDMDPNGNFIVAWRDENDPDGNNDGVVGQAYDFNGDPVGTEFLVNDQSTGNQYDPRVAFGNAGSLIVAYTDDSGEDGDLNGVFARQFVQLANGPELLVNEDHTDGEQEEPATGIDGSGNFVIAWSDGDGTDGDGYGVLAQRYNSAGVPQGVSFVVNADQTTNGQYRPDIAINTTGDFVIVWVDEDGTDGDLEGIFGQRYNSSGVAQGSNFQVNNDNTDGNQTNPKVAMDSSGNFVVVWQNENGDDGDQSGIYGQRFDSSGVAQGSEFLVNTDTSLNQDNPEIAMDDSGNFVVTWTDENSPDGDGTAVVAQRYNSSGVAQGGSFVVNSTTAGDQVLPVVAMDADGDFVVAWFDTDGADGDSFGVFAQRFNGSGVAQGSEFLVNDTTDAEQSNPSVGMDADGNFVITWRDENDPDEDNDGVQAKRFNSGGTELSSEFLVNTQPIGNQFEPNISMNADGDFVIAYTDDSGEDGDMLGVFAQLFSAPAPPVPTAPSAVSNLAATPGNLEVVLTWSAPFNGNDPITDYLIEYGTTAGWPGNAMVFSDGVSASTGATVTGLSNGTSYTFRVFAVNGIGTGPSSNEVSSTPGLPSAINNLAASTGNTEVDLTWSAPAAGGSAITDYIIEYGETSGFPGNAAVFADGTSASTGATVGGLTNGTEYSFRVFAVNALGTGPSSNVVTETPSTIEASSNDFLVNTFTADDQNESRVAMDVSGNFVIVWVDGLGTQEIGFERFNSSGVAQGGDVPNTTHIGNQNSPAIAMDDAGNFVIAWRDANGTDGNLSGIFARRYNNSGVAQDVSEFLVNTTTTGNQQDPSVSMNKSTGDFIISWTDTGGADGGGSGIFAQRYTSTGVTVGSEFVVNSSTSGNQTESHVAMSRTGEFVIVFRDGSGLDGSGDGIFGRLFDNTGSPVASQFQVNTITVANQQEPHVDMDENGNFVVLYKESGTPKSIPYFRRYDSSGVAQGAEVQVDPGSDVNFDREPSRMAVEAGGAFIVSWRDIAGRDGDGDGVFAHRMSDVGTFVSPEFQVNQGFTGDQSEPDLATNGSDLYVMTWVDNNGRDSDGDGVYARLFSLIPDPVPTPPASGGGGSGTISQNLQIPSPDGFDVLGSDSIRYKWTYTGTNHSGFRILSTDASLLAQLADPARRAWDYQELQHNTTYSGIRMKAYNSLAETQLSNAWDEAVTEMIPVTPRLLFRDNDIKLTIPESLNNLTMGQSGVQFEILTPSSQTSASAVIPSEWLQTRDYTFTGVSQDQEVQVRARARNQAGVETDWSPYITVPAGSVEEIDFAVGLSLTTVGGQPVKRPVNPESVLFVSVSVQNISDRDASNVVTNMVLPRFMQYVPGSLRRGGASLSDGADQDGGLASDNGITSLLETLPAGDSFTVTFQLSFDQSALKSSADNNKTREQELQRALAAANPVILLQASVSSNESTNPSYSNTVEVEPDTSIYSETVTAPAPTPTPNPAPTTSPAPSPTTSPVPSPVQSPSTETQSEGGELELFLTANAQNEGSLVEFTGTTSQPNTTVIVTLDNSITRRTTSDLNGIWRIFVSVEELGIEEGQDAMIEMRVIAERDGQVSNEIVEEVAVSRTSQGEVVVEIQPEVSVQPLLDLIQEQEEIVETALTVTVPVVLLGSAPLWGYLPYLPTLFFHFISWLLSLFRKKKEGKLYGTVYDSITKQPLALAIVRIYRDSKLVATEVTDKQGRYEFLLEPRNYRLEVKKPEYFFPSKIVTSSADGEYQHVYQAEQMLEINEHDLALPDVPMDPMNTKRSFQLANIIKKLWLGMQAAGHYLAVPLLFVGAIASIAMVVANPQNSLNWILALVYVLMFSLQLIFREHKEKPWGIVYEVSSNAAVPLATIQLIDPEFGKVVKSRLSDYQGRYSFLPDPGKYVIRASKEGYSQADIVEAPKSGRRPIAKEIAITKSGERISGDVAMHHS